jgi:hypothetical protein
LVEEEWEAEALSIIELFLLPSARKPILNVMLDLNQGREISVIFFLPSSLSHPFCPFFNPPN